MENIAKECEKRNERQEESWRIRKLVNSNPKVAWALM